MRVARLTCSLLLLAVLGAGGGTVACQQEADPDAAGAALQAGDYDRALPMLRRAAATDTAARTLLLRGLMETGAYDEAQTVAEGYSRQNPKRWRLALADVLVTRGQLARAESLYRAEYDAGSDLIGRVRLAGVLAQQGRWIEARGHYLAVMRSAARGALTAEELTAAATAYEAMGVDDPDRYRAALRLYDAAAEAAPDRLEPRIALGNLFLAKYNRPDALATFDGILATNPRYAGALVGKARVEAAEGSGDPVALLSRALEVNPNLVAARVALGSSQLDREAYPEAEQEARRALGVNPASLEALTLLAMSHLFRGDTVAYEAARTEALGRNPRYADFYSAVAEQSARNRFYRQAAALAAVAIAIDSTSARGYATLGLNQLRIGEIEAGRQTLETAFILDPYNVWVKNTLDMLDAVARYVERSSPRFRFVASASDADLLVPYLAPLAEEAYDRLSAQYGYQPPTPIRVELYRHHADFSVRTVGLAGLGALGVSFGPVLAMDAPSARDRGDFNWASTFWHELAHTFTMGVTEHRIPRWFSEGLSVLEERRARRGWGAGVTLGFLKAYARGRLLPVSRLNDGFVRPAYPEQVPFSYYQASLVCEMIETTRGPGAIRAMLDAYRRGRTTPEVFREALDAEPGVFDAEFDGWFRQRFAGPLDAVKGEGGGAFAQALATGSELLAAGQQRAAREALEHARDLFPEYVEAGNPYWLLARLHREAGRPAEAAEALAHLTALSETAYDANLAEAEVRQGIGDPAGAAAALDRAVHIDPRDAVLHRRLAELAAQIGDWRTAVRERQAVLALGPLDQADAQYQLALAWYGAGDLDEARRAVLQALEAAPAFEAAQELLLRIREGRP